MRDDADMTRDQLADELNALRRKVAEMEARENDRASEAARERDRLRAIIDTLPERIFFKDTQSRFTIVNRQAARRWGFRHPDEMIGKTDFDLMSREEAQLRFEEEREMMRTGLPLLDREERLSDGLGKDRWAQANKVPLRDESGAVIGIVGVTRDVTERRRAEDALRESEATHRFLFEHSPMPMMVFDAETLAILLVNEAAVRHYGYSPEEFRALTLKDIRPPEDVPRLIEHLAQNREGIDQARVWRHLKKDETLMLVEVTSHPVTYGGRPARHMMVNDITERERAQDALIESRRMLQLVLDTIPVRVFWKNRDSVYLGCNRLFALDAGLTSPDEIVGKNDHELGWAEQADQYRLDDRQVMESGEAKLNYEEPETTPKGGRLWVRTSKIPLCDREGRGVGVLGTYEDITKRKRDEEERRNLEAQVQQAQKLESLGVLAGGIAHDFNNLLTGILGNADLALMALSPVSPARENVQAIENAARRAAELCRQMLAYSGRGRFVVEPVDVSEVVREMAHLLEVSISKKAALKYHFAASLPAVEADATQIRQIVMNLITNASEAIGERSGVITIATGAMECDPEYLKSSYLDEQRPEGRYVYLEVSDTGCGMDEETQARIFDPFFTTKFTGRGLGLAAVLGIVRGHDGAIKVYSEPGRGTTFKVLFPARDRAVKPIDDKPGARDDWRGNGTILLVDDEETVRSVGKSMLERAGFRVLIAEDGRQALDVFRQRCGEIDCVVLDLTMPHMDGEETFRELRRVRGDVRVVLSSGYNEQDVVHRFAGKDLAGFVQKPYQHETLIGQVRNALGG